MGKHGHLIKTCHGPRHIGKNKGHHWIDGTLSDVVVPVDVFHLHTMFQNEIKHEQRFDFNRVPAVLELCCQAGAVTPDEILDHTCHISETKIDDVHLLSAYEVKKVAQKTLRAWETLRERVQQLLLVYPAKVCKYCSEVHVGPSGHKVRLCGMFKYEGWRGSHIWEKANVDYIVPPKIVWHKRPHDPEVLLDSGRGYYGHLPAVVELCLQAGATVPVKYFCMMKVNGFTLEDAIRVHAAA